MKPATLNPERRVAQRFQRCDLMPQMWAAFAAEVHIKLNQDPQWNREISVHLTIRSRSRVQGSIPSTVPRHTRRSIAT